MVALPSSVLVLSLATRSGTTLDHPGAKLYWSLTIAAWASLMTVFLSPLWHGRKIVLVTHLLGTSLLVVGVASGDAALRWSGAGLFAASHAWNCALLWRNMRASQAACFLALVLLSASSAAADGTRDEPAGTVPADTATQASLPDSVWADADWADVDPYAEGDTESESVSGSPSPITAIQGIEEIPEMSAADRTNLRTMMVLTAVWFFAMGASVGSFVNLVAYRLPRGMPVLVGGSRCPSCGAGLTFRENMPIIGWLRTLGRCRWCGAPIPIRYLAVEVAVGLIFVALLFVELLSGGASVPLRTPNGYAGVVWVIWYPKWDLIGLYTYHCVLLAGLVVLTLVAWDGLRWPWRLAVFLALLGLTAPVAAATLHPVPPFSFRPDWMPAKGFGPGEIVTGLLGLIAGALLGALLAQRELKGPGAGGQIVGLGLVGIYLGWQAAASVALASSFALLAVGLTIGPWRGRLLPKLAVGAITLATLLQILFWRRLSELAYWPGPTSSWVGVGLCFMLVAVAGVGLRIISRNKSGSAAGW